jgi:hypothetical protein
MLLVAAAGVGADCLGVMDPIVFHDMHDGDMKQIEASGFAFQITPFNNSETWAVYGYFDVNCVAVVNFSVPGKPNPPPSNLTMTMWVMESTDIKRNKLGFEFTDPTGKLGPSDKPLNFWIMDKWPKPVIESKKPQHESCLQQNNLIVNDIHDGDEKEVDSGRSGAIHITPYQNNQTWSVDATFDEQCIASVNFQVPGKPNPPSVPLAARVWGMSSVAGKSKNVLEFTDPSGTLAPPTLPLNVWVPDNDNN